MTTTWKELFTNYKIEGELQTTLTDEEMITEFHDGYGGSEGRPFTAWDDKWVYFPIVYDGAEWIGRAPRNPCEIKTHHQGGE